MKPESAFRAKVRDFLKPLRLYSDGIQQVAKHGSPDFYLCIYGDFGGLELKAEGGKLSPAQKRKRDEILQHGYGFYIVAHPGNWDVVKRAIEGYAKGQISREDFREITKAIRRENGKIEDV